MIVAAIDGESLDALVWRATGGAKVEHVLAANPNLSATALALPGGTTVDVPPLPANRVRTDVVHLWD